jgi:hypothetical protein
MCLLSECWKNDSLQKLFMHFFLVDTGFVCSSVWFRALCSCWSCAYIYCLLLCVFLFSYLYAVLCCIMLYYIIFHSLFWLMSYSFDSPFLSNSTVIPSVWYFASFFLLFLWALWRSLEGHSLANLPCIGHSARFHWFYSAKDVVTVYW